MSGSKEASQVLNIEQVLRLHNLTKDVSKLCERQLRTYLDGLAPLFRPRRILGDFVEGSGRESTSGAAQNLNELRESFQRACGRPIDLHRELTTPIESISTQLQIYPWEYLHEISASNSRKKVRVSSPLTWVVSYPSTYSLSMLRQVVAGGHERDLTQIGEFVLRACIMALLFNKIPSMKALFEGLRYSVEIRNSPELGQVPLVTISAPFPSFRPSDEIVLVASGLSGGNAFQEIIDVETIRRVADPLQTQIQELLKSHGEEPEA